jgi:hypothetical protein
MNSNNDIVFIGGTGRCGTNVLKDILTSHKDICSLPFETKFIFDPDGIIDFYSSVNSIWSPYYIDLKIKRLLDMLHNVANKNFSSSKYSDWELNRYFDNFNLCIEKLADSLTDFKYFANHHGLIDSREMFFMAKKDQKELQLIFRDFLLSIFDNYMEKNFSEIYIDDSTHSILFINEINEILPESKFIYMYRDARDVISSLKKQRWTPTNVRDVAIWYKSVITHWKLVRDTIDPSVYIEIDLYDLVDDRNNTLKRICDFIDITYDEVFSLFDLSKSNRGRWKSDLTDNEIQYLKEFDLFDTRLNF